jgi:hypothetical protein
MKMTHIEEEKEKIEFLERAKKSFSENKEFHTYTDNGRIENGEFFAIRWGIGGDCIVIFKVSEECEPINFQNVLEKRLSDSVNSCPDCGYKMSILCPKCDI